MLTKFVATALVLALTATAQSDATCYRRSNGQVQPQMSSYFACNGTSTSSGGAQLCCLDGYECGQDSICHKTSGDNTERWMVGGCTDSEYHDDVCRRDCTGDKQTFITWNSGKSQWQCCGKDGCDEGDATDESFKAVSPSQWSAVDKGTSNSPSSGSGNNNNNSNNSSGGDNLSLGEKIGIGVAAGVVAIAIVAAAVFWFRSGTKRSRKDHRGVRGRYEELGRVGRAPSPQPYAARDASPQPYGRSTSPVPPVRSMEPQRGRSRSPAVDERTPLPAGLTVGSGDGPAAPDSLSVLSRDRD